MLSEKDVEVTDRSIFTVCQEVEALGLNFYTLGKKVAELEGGTASSIAQLKTTLGDLENVLPGKLSSLENSFNAGMQEIAAVKQLLLTLQQDVGNLKTMISNVTSSSSISSTSVPNVVAANPVVPDVVTSSAATSSDATSTAASTVVPSAVIVPEVTPEVSPEATPLPDTTPETSPCMQPAAPLEAANKELSMLHSFLSKSDKEDTTAAAPGQKLYLL